MSWYRRYRPTTVRQLHLVSVRLALEGMMANGSFPHAFLFAGPKGTGKTSSARILAAMLNDPVNSAAVDQLFFETKKSSKSAKRISFQEPNQNDELVRRIQRGASYVVSELDAASNRGIDDIRQLKERIFLPPQEGKVSVYILDEAHMLTTEAFNALLKILEEPPSHVVFILATTELHKIPETIISRCALIRFHKASAQELTQAMEEILTTEQIAFEAGVLPQLAQSADGSFRDAVKLLELVASNKKHISISDVMAATQGTQQAQIRELLQAIVAKQEQKVVAFFKDLRQVGSDPKFFYTQLITFLHQQLLVAITEGDQAAEFSAKIAHYLLTQFASVGNEIGGPIAFLGLELKALEMIFKSKEKNGVSTDNGAKQPSVGQKRKSSAIAGEPNPSALSEELIDVARSLPIALHAYPPLLNDQEIGKPDQQTIIRAQQVIEKWDDFLAMVRERNSSIEALLRSSKPLESSGEKTQVEVYYQFHREQLQQPKFRLLLDECSQALFGGNIAFEFLLAEASRPGAELSTVSGKVDESDTLIQLAKEILV